MSKNYWITLICLVVSVVNAYAQNADEDLKNISLKYNTANQLIMKQQISYYVNSSAITPEETTINIFKKNYNMVYSNAFNQETIVNNGLFLWVDHVAKIVMLNHIEDYDLENSLTLDLVSLKEMSYKSEYKEDNQLACYSLYFKIGKHSKSEVWYNKENLEVTKIINYMRDNSEEMNSIKKIEELPRIEILFIDTKINAPIDTSIFALEQFIDKSNESFHLKADYKEYQLINNIEN